VLERKGEANYELFNYDPAKRCISAFENYYDANNYELAMMYWSSTCHE
jgi:hypothetical protein